MRCTKLVLYLYEFLNTCILLDYFLFIISLKKNNNNKREIFVIFSKYTLSITCEIRICETFQLHIRLSRATLYLGRRTLFTQCNKGHIFFKDSVILRPSIHQKQVKLIVISCLLFSCYYWCQCIDSFKIFLHYFYIFSNILREGICQYFLFLKLKYVETNSPKPKNFILPKSQMLATTNEIFAYYFRSLHCHFKIFKRNVSETIGSNKFLESLNTNKRLIM